ncbi:TetR/AcrR family transcriptional regulator, partial [Stenotrophomonas maltophilia]|nr:TetR/AcrR family transcriptional regulator [Stenotrophomonas maltophilia]
VQGLQQFLAIWRERLLRSEFSAGCPVLAAAVEEPVEAVPSQPRAAAAAVFMRWQGHLAAAFIADGHQPAVADGLASLVIASVEGAVAMCRALQDIAPFDQVAAQLLKAAAPPAR